MRRRIMAVAALAFALWATTAAGAQTTTSTSTSTSSSSTTSSTATSTTSTTVANPCTGRPCTPSPPVALLSGVNGEVRIESFAFCWRQPEPEPQGLVTLCTTPTLGTEPAHRLVVQRGETLTLRFEIDMAPTEASVSVDGERRPLTPGNPVRFVADLAPGSHAASFATVWLQGDVSYYVGLDVRAAATPTAPRGIALTG